MPDAIAPDGSEIYFRALDAERASLVEVVLQPGLTSRPVRHRTVEEIWFFLSGSGEVWLRSEDRTVDAKRHVGPGETITIPTGWAFQFRTLWQGAVALLVFHLSTVAGCGGGCSGRRGRLRISQSLTNML